MSAQESDSVTVGAFAFRKHDGHYDLFGPGCLAEGDCLLLVADPVVALDIAAYLNVRRTRELYLGMEFARAELRKSPGWELSIPVEWTKEGKRRAKKDIAPLADVVAGEAQL